MRSLRDIGETEAALVMEKSLRMGSDTPVVRASHARVLKSKRQVGSWREVSALHMAAKGILALPRSYLQTPNPKGPLPKSTQDINDVHIGEGK